jgi:hypothetical protein
MMLQRILVIAGTLGTCACAVAVQSSRPKDLPREALTRAIEQAGGAEALTRATALEWEGVASVHAANRDVSIAGKWEVQPPDSALVTTYEVSQGPAAERALVLASPRGWLVGGDKFTPMPPSMLASERAEFYLYQLIRLVSLQDPSVKLSAAASDTLHQTGVQVEQRGRPAAFLYMDACGRLSHVRMQVPSAETGKLEWQDAWLSGVIEAQGVRWPRELRLLEEGKPYFDLLLQSFRVAPRLTNPLLRGPG